MPTESVDGAGGFAVSGDRALSVTGNVGGPFYPGKVMDARDALVPVQAGRLVRLRDVGRNEFWLQDWLCTDLTRLGLGSLRLVEQEQTQAGGGNLDILAAAGDTYYSIEVQLGEVDASHSFRVFDYWARNRRRFPSKTHVAVLVAESTVGRFRIALEELSEYVPLLVVELRSWQGTTEVIIVPELVVTNDSVDVSGTPLAVTAGESRSEGDWQDALTDDAWQFHLEFADWARQHLGPITLDYSPKSYIGVRVGRRVWAPLWPRKDGAQVYLPDPDQSRSEESPAYAHFRELLAEQGYTLNWQTTYNAGANPVSLRLRRSDLLRPEVQELLDATYRAIQPGALAWSEIASAPTDRDTMRADGDAGPDDVDIDPSSYSSNHPGQSTHRGGGASPASTTRT